MFETVSCFSKYIKFIEAENINFMPFLVDINIIICVNNKLLLMFQMLNIGRENYFTKSLL